MKIINIILIIIYVIAYVELKAGIITKEPYSIPEDVKCKENLNIAFADFTGELPEERDYVKKLLKNRITEIISAFKRIRINYSAVDF